MEGLILEDDKGEENFQQCQDGRVVQGARLKALPSLPGGTWPPNGGVGSNPTSDPPFLLKAEVLNHFLKK